MSVAMLAAIQARSDSSQGEAREGHLVDWIWIGS